MCAGLRHTTAHFRQVIADVRLDEQLVENTNGCLSALSEALGCFTKHFAQVGVLVLLLAGEKECYDQVHESLHCMHNFFAGPTAHILPSSCRRHLTTTFVRAWRFAQAMS